MNNININKNTSQSGRSMIEMLGVLAIVGVLSVGGIAGYSKAMEKFKINKRIDQISHIVTNIRTLYAQQTTYAGLDEQTAIKMGVIPDGLTTSNSWPYITNAFGGRVLIMDVNSYWAGQSNLAPFESFVVHFGGLSKEACVTLATMDWGSPSSSGFISLSVGDAGAATGPFTDFGDSCDNDWQTTACHGNINNPTPMSVATAAEGCSSCASTSSGCAIGLRFQ